MKVYMKAIRVIHPEAIKQSGLLQHRLQPRQVCKHQLANDCGYMIPLHPIEQLPLLLSSLQLTSSSANVWFTSPKERKKKKQKKCLPLCVCRFGYTLFCFRPGLISICSMTQSRSSTPPNLIHRGIKKKWILFLEIPAHFTFEHSPRSLRCNLGRVVGWGGSCGPSAGHPCFLSNCSMMSDQRTNYELQKCAKL